ncbi:MAG: F0F1 ATP synthase subunit B [Parabacteroides sp.]
MSLLTPDSGLLFWMLLSFGIVVGILCKYGFPVILKAVEQRKAFIAQSLDAAREANAQLARIQAEGDALLAKAKEQQARLMKEAMQTKEQIVQEAREQARLEGQQQLEKAMQQIQEEKQRALQEMQQEISGLSIRIAEKIIRRQIEQTEEQQAMVNRLLDEMTLSKS